jgi:CrcB protein
MEFALTVALAWQVRLMTPIFRSRRGTPNVLAYLWISLGAIVGASARYFISRFVAKAVTASFPYGTLLINVTGSFILGLFLVWSTERALPDPRWRLLIAIGFCGSYTTFSSYAFESFSLFEQGHYMLFASNVLANNMLCLSGVLAGAMIARSI